MLLLKMMNLLMIVFSQQLKHQIFFTMKVTHLFESGFKIVWCSQSTFLYVEVFSFQRFIVTSKQTYKTCKEEYRLWVAGGISFISLTLITSLRRKRIKLDTCVYLGKFLLKVTISKVNNTCEKTCESTIMTK